MAEPLFEARRWDDDKVQFPGRRRIIYPDSSFKDVYVERSQGTVYQEGDEFNAAVMNDLEKRIQLAFEQLEAQVNDPQAQLNMYYPVGKILMSMVNFKLESNPANIFPNTKSTWIRLNDNRILLPVTSGAGQTFINETVRNFSYKVYNAGQTSATYPSGNLVNFHNLSTDEMPSHSHGFTDKWSQNDTGAGQTYVTKCSDYWYYEYSDRWLPTSDNHEDEDGSIRCASSNTYIQEGTSTDESYHYYESGGGLVGHDHPFSYSVTFQDGNTNALQTVQKSIKVYVWQRTG